MFLGVPVTSSDSENSAVVGGVVGGVIVLLMIIVVLSIVIVCVRRSHEKGKFTLNDKVLYNTTKLNTNVTIEYNPSYDVAKVNAMDNSSTITPGNSDFPITPNPSYCTHNETTDKYGNEQHNDPEGSDVPITINPSYNVHTKPYCKASKYDYDYVQPNELIQHSDLEDTIKMDTNPSYGVSTEKRHDYDYVSDEHLLHHDTSPNYNGDMNEDTIQIHPNVDQRKKTHSPYSSGSAMHGNKGEYDIVNQPRS